MNGSRRGSAENSWQKYGLSKGTLIPYYDKMAAKAPESKPLSNRNIHIYFNDRDRPQSICKQCKYLIAEAINYYAENVTPLLRCDALELAQTIVDTEEGSMIHGAQNTTGCLNGFCKRDR